MKAANRIILNTGVLYGQLLIQLLLGIITTRIVLEALGEIDYGVYMLVAGVVSMLGIFSSSMINTSMRYIAYTLGKDDVELIKKTFTTTLYIHLMMGFLVVLVMELGGWLMFQYMLNIPLDKIFDAKVVYQFMIATTFITIISVPYDAVMNAHEHIFILSLVDVLGFVLNLLLAIYLFYIDDFLLIQYGLFMFLIQILLRLIKQKISKRRYEECRWGFKRNAVDRKLVKEMLAFTGWNLFGIIGVLFTEQLRGIFLNLFFGVKLNAAEGLGKQVNAAINKLSTGITKAITPQLNKSEGAGDRAYMIKMTNVGIKYTTFMFTLVAIPFIFECEYFLELWLGQVPAYTVIFCQLILLQQLVDKFTWQIGNAIRAVGTIKNYQIMEGCIFLLGVPISWGILYNGGKPISIFIVELILLLIIAGVRIFYGRKIVGLVVSVFFEKTIYPVLIPMSIASIFAYIIYSFLLIGFFRVFCVFLVFISIFSFLFYYYGMSRQEKRFLKDMISSILKRIK